MRNIKKAFIALATSLILFSCNEKYADLKDGLYADIQTSKGDILVQLEFEKAPITVANFVSLAEGKNPFVEEIFKGKPFYDGLLFHRVLSNFMIQGGDPNGDGSGGPGYKFKDEFHEDLKHDAPGILSMANSGPDTNGSQFFITHKETPWLDRVHTVFGHVVEGQDVVNAIVQDDVIEKISIIRKGNEAKKFDAVKIFKDYYSIEAENQKKAAEALEEIKKEQVVKINALKMSGTKTSSGLVYKIEKGEGKKPNNGQEVYIQYSGFLTNGELFDSSVEAIAEKFGKLNPRKAAANAYQPLPFNYGTKQGLIPGFIEALDLLSFGDKGTFYIPAILGYGAQGSGNVIPPNADIVFEIELLENLPNQ
ncbi:peptidylprolyl isomerase [Flavobacterium sediminis]|uniref:peptidylprolyl isomerase n=1 Tax=Flavobacterium sediminis TaxID=2201181 RepID=A0A2U8QW79_9FLAO|nr:peptidylprolyl isomerase [Flavobacterium sediminis]AWM14460.1 peptidylprolyl isomerase [Flavobacterium sediminis]